MRTRDAAEGIAAFLESVRRNGRASEMTFDVEIVLRHENEATVEQVVHPGEPRDWTEADVREVLKRVLLAVNRVGRPGDAEPAVSLRGFSWIVEPFDATRVVLAIEIPMGAAVAGPFETERGRLEQLVSRAIETDRHSATTVH